MLQIGNNAPPFTITLADGTIRALKAYQGRYLLLYFFPRANTPGCTKQANMFDEALAQYTAANCAILGISPDTPAKQARFQAKYNIGFDLGCDEDTTVCKAYGVWQEKTLYGRKFFGVVRTSFLLGPQGKILEIWPKVKVADHSMHVLAALKAHKR